MWATYTDPSCSQHAVKVYNSMARCNKDLKENTAANDPTSLFFWMLCMYYGALHWSILSKLAVLTMPHLYYKH